MRWLALSLAAALACPAQAQTTLNVVTAGDQNMVDYVNTFLAPRFEKLNPGVTVKAVGTGPGDAGSFAGTSATTTAFVDVFVTPPAV